MLHRGTDSGEFQRRLRRRWVTDFKEPSLLRSRELLLEKLAQALDVLNPRFLSLPEIQKN